MPERKYDYPVWIESDDDRKLYRRTYRDWRFHQDASPERSLEEAELAVARKQRSESRYPLGYGEGRDEPITHHPPPETTQRLVTEITEEEEEAEAQKNWEKARLIDPVIPAPPPGRITAKGSGVFAQLYQRFKGGNDQTEF